MTLVQTPIGQETPVFSASAAHAKAVELGKHVVRMTTAAGSGHPSTALSLTHIVVELMYRQMRYDPADPWNPASDRLVLSIGHAVPVVYAAYADLGGAVGTDPDNRRSLTIDDLSTLRELDSVLDGHPNPAEGFPFFDAATGSLGQGLSVAAGLALAARADRIDKRIFVISGDGESREGQVWEAADFCIDHNLNHVCLILSCNGQGQAAPVSTQQSAEVLAAKMAAFGWHVIEVDGHDPDELSAAFTAVGNNDKPTVLIARTIKGWGIESIQRKNFHGKPFPANEVDQACAELDATGAKLGAAPGGSMKPQPRSCAARAKSARPITIVPFDAALKDLGLEDALGSKKLATRKAFGVALVALGDANAAIVSLDGDVSNSTFSNMFAKKHPERFFECKIAEQNMVSAAAGMAATDKIPFASSFAKFITRGTDQIDMAAISRANIKIVGSHAGVSLGADGPSQMSLADVAYFRSMTRTDDGRGRLLCHLFQPSDAISAYRCTELMANIDGLCCMRTYRPDAPFLYPFDERFEPYGCKKLRSGDRLTIVSCGYILHTALQAAEELAASGIDCSVFDAYTFPLDSSPILADAQAGGRAILTVEDNFIGGLHSEIAEAAGESGEIKVAGLTVRRIPKSAKTAGEVFSLVGVGLQQIVEKGTALVGK